MRRFALLSGTVATMLGLVGGAAHAQSTAIGSFGDFVGGLRAASAADWLKRPESRVRDAAELDAMRAHLLALYGGIAARRSFAADGQLFDCIALADQPSVRLLGETEIAKPPREPADGGAVAGSTATAGQACDPGSIPMRRITLDEITRFRTLRAFLSKEPADLEPPNTKGHAYAVTYQYVTAHGAETTLDLWSPKVNGAASQIFSLAQAWVVGTSPTTQTLEAGWQNYPQKYNTTKSVLFIYWTADDYRSTGCYNLECVGFVQTSSTLHLGAPFAHYSTIGGTQYETRLGYKLIGKNWWLRQGSSWVGYYPAKQYGSGSLRTAANLIEFGGETVGSTSWPPMGSGRFAAAGTDKAAYQRVVQYFTAANAVQDARLTAYQPSPACYTAKLTGGAGTSWKSAFFFGGPGGPGC